MVGISYRSVPRVMSVVPVQDGYAAVAALVRTGDEAVQRGRHVASGVRHREPPG
jgi:hypothetical protein